MPRASKGQRRYKLLSDQTHGYFMPLSCFVPSPVPLFTGLCWHQPVLPRLLGNLCPGTFSVFSSLSAFRSLKPCQWTDMTYEELHSKGHLIRRISELSFYQHLPASRESKTRLPSHFSSFTFYFRPSIFNFHIFPYTSHLISSPFCQSCVLQLTLSQGSRTLGLGQQLLQHWASSGCRNGPSHSGMHKAISVHGCKLDQSQVSGP